MPFLATTAILQGLYEKQSQSKTPVMATRRGRAILEALASSPASTPFLRKSAASSSLIGVAGGHGASNSRWSSSSSSSSPSSSTSPEKPKRKLIDRLSSVIDSVNDRKLPPELRGQRNAVRYLAAA